MDIKIFLISYAEVALKEKERKREFHIPEWYNPTSAVDFLGKEIERKR